MKPDPISDNDANQASPPEKTREKRDDASSPQQGAKQANQWLKQISRIMHPGPSTPQAQPPPQQNPAERLLPIQPDNQAEQEMSEDLSEQVARWLRRLLIPLVILAWTTIVLLLLWLAGHVAKTILMLMIAALLAYALSPAVSLFARVMPRVVSILLVYLLILGGLGVLLYFIVRTAIEQLLSLSQTIQTLLTPGPNGQPAPLELFLQSIGITSQQLANLRGQVVGQLEGIAGQIIPIVSGIVNAILDLVLIAVLSIYLVLEGEKPTHWLRQSLPWRQRGRVSFTVETMRRIVGGYIRGQLFLCTLIGVLVGVGMTLLGVPYGLLLGVLAFLLEFIPILGTMVSGIVCVLLALTKGWLIALIVLIYFVGVHVLEGDVLGPRIVGKTIGLHPIVSLVALLAGSELFGIWGALFAAPVAGLMQAVLIALWTEWQANNPQEFSATAPETMPIKDETETSSQQDQPL
ncbi:AI-2E family transporter [Ktedonosporobacter rubrisoli]|uniref:AI-2E family transporter n=1 Tax=Ktedonosporobacter rubrisoli TaxID=2509675 RepID=A0A4P6JN90_KTERU|nr:AI-2E family transporter [Ktedonosporobacter rubrisoli]QBD76695.1 AI-2E family transporter [Ktedonosporobacter rubrisoli]